VAVIVDLARLVTARREACVGAALDTAPKQTDANDADKLSLLYYLKTIVVASFGRKILYG
jgi:hypothetical protein